MGSNVGLQVLKLLSLSGTGTIHCAYMGYFILCTGFWGGARDGLHPLMTFATWSWK